MVSVTVWSAAGSKATPSVGTRVKSSKGLKESNDAAGGRSPALL